MTNVGTIRLAVGQAIARFLVNQYIEHDGQEHHFVSGAFGIFGHGNVCGIGQVILQNEIDPEPDGNSLPYIMPRNEQGMVSAAVAYTKAISRQRIYMCTFSIGPGALNMVTDAALATTNRLPVLLLSGDIFVTRIPDPVLQQVENAQILDISVNDAFRPVSVFFDRIDRPEQLTPSLMRAFRALTDPTDTGAVTLALPQDVQAEAFDFPAKAFMRRVWHIRRSPLDRASLNRAVAAIKAAKQPLIVVGGGVKYSEASRALCDFTAATGMPVSDTQADKEAINSDRPQTVGGVGSIGCDNANHLAGETDLIIGVGTRYSDFTAASRTAFRNPDVSFVNTNVKALGATKNAGEMLVAGACEAPTDLTKVLEGWHVCGEYTQKITQERATWEKATHELYHLDHKPLPSQLEVFDALNEMMDNDGIVINATGSMPGGLQALWQAKNPKQYHMEYTSSTTGYEIPAGMEVKPAYPKSEVVSVAGDGTYQMLPMELATVVQERLKVIYVLLQNHDFASVGALSESYGSQRFGTHYTMGGRAAHNEPGEYIPVDTAENAQSWGLGVLCASIMDEFREAFRKAKVSDRATMIYIETDLYGPNSPSSSW